MNAQAELDRAFATAGAQLGETVTYSRAASAGFDAVAPFVVSGFVNTSGQFAGPTGPLAAEITLPLSDIPFGPQKGDQITWNGHDYKVQSFGVYPEIGTCALGIRRLN